MVDPEVPLAEGEIELLALVELAYSHCISMKHLPLELHTVLLVFAAFIDLN